MAYRLLLPSTKVLYPKNIEEAIDQFDVYRTSDVTPTWSMCDLALDVADAGAHRLTLRLLRDDSVEQEEDERHFTRPEGTRVWLELRIPGAADDRERRLAARLCAMTISTQLDLPVLETRNGVLCQSPEAFTAWCSRSAHPDTVLLGETDHITAPKQGKVRVQGPKQPRSMAPVAPAHAALPPVGPYMRLWRKWRNLRTYIVSVPPKAEKNVLYALQEEIASTFGDRNVEFDAEHHRLLIVAKASAGTVDIVSYYRRRAHPERLRLASAAR